MRARGKNRIIQYSGVFAASLLVTLAAVYFYSPTAGTHANTVNMGVEVGSVINMSLDKSSLALGGNPGQFTSGNIAATISTNSAFGYTLAIEDADNNTSLTSETSEDAFTSTFSGSRTEETMENNTWGFSIDAENFYKIPVKNSPVIVKRVQSHIDGDSDSSTVTIGAKIGQSITSGLYTDRLLLSAYANGVDGEPEGVDPDSEDPHEIGDEPEPYEEGEGTNENRLVLARSMQDPKLKQYCASTYTPTRDSDVAAFTRYFNGNQTPKAILKDKRDNKTYQIAKLADGHCWMTQNIAIIGMTISSDLSDVVNDFTIADSDFSKLANNPVTVNAAYLHDDPKRGGYYNWMTATAGTGPRESGNFNNATASICPKGWRLPSSGSNSEYQTIADLYNWQRLTGLLEFSTTGYITTLSHGYAGGGLYWSYLITGEWGAETFYVTASGGVYATGGTAKDVGAHVRCILREG